MSWEEVLSLEAARRELIYGQSPTWYKTRRNYLEDEKPQAKMTVLKLTKKARCWKCGTVLEEKPYGFWCPKCKHVRNFKTYMSRRIR
jgi:rubrerythrin